MKKLMIIVLFVPAMVFGQVPTVYPDLAVRGELDLPTHIVKTVMVEGQGTTPALARQDAFRAAIERTVGIAIVTETQVNNHRLVRDQTATFSHARISNFAVASLEQRGPLWHTVVWVTVRSACMPGTQCLN